jgi:hypothetical protein
VTQWNTFGHTGGYSEFQYSPSADLVVVVNVTDAIYVPDGRYDAVQDLLAKLFAVVIS